MLKLRQISNFFGVGAVASFIALSVLWVVYKLFGQYADFVKVEFDIVSFYMPIFWGGVVSIIGGFFPHKMSTKTWTYLLGVLAAFALCVDKFSWASSLLEGRVNFENFLRFDVLSLLVVFTLCWGYLYRELSGGNH